MHIYQRFSRYFEEQCFQFCSRLCEQSLLFQVTSIKESQSRFKPKKTRKRAKTGQMSIILFVACVLLFSWIFTVFLRITGNKCALLLFHTKISEVSHQTSCISEQRPAFPYFEVLPLLPSKC